MKSVRIIAGSYRGRVIPFDVRKFNDADITPQKVKEALFSILGDISGKYFLDLFGGSGQVGFEAVSRGAKGVVINESDRRRYEFIRHYAMQFPEDERPVVLNYPAFRALRFLHNRERYFDCIYIDPPYEKISGKVPVYVEILDEVGRYRDICENAIIILQHFSANELNRDIRGFSFIKRRDYGSTALSFYKFVTHDTDNTIDNI